ncbi:hypothetical protein [Shewanella hanedai]|uniref:hypothetical protein n=1 Tax=Shewanella hanedai TaxID=25 RepID=UPI00188C13FF|nr:hypothetical protein [Shewanella hanedai]
MSLKRLERLRPWRSDVLAVVRKPSLRNSTHTQLEAIDNNEQTTFKHTTQYQAC